MTVRETFFALEVADIARATTFYTTVFGATVAFASPGWTSTHVAGVRIGLVPNPAHVPTQTGLHFAVDDLAAACAAVERGGGHVAIAPTEVAPGVTIAVVVDTEGNELALRGP